MRLAEPLQKTREELKFRVSDDQPSPQVDQSGRDAARSEISSSAQQDSNYEDALRSEVQSAATSAASQISPASTATQESSTQFESPEASPPPQAASSAASAPPKTPTAPSDPEDLMDIITSPHASEADWVDACHQLDKHEQKKARKKKKLTFTKRTVAFVSALVLGATIGAAAIFHWGPFAPPQPSYAGFMKALEHDIKDHWHPPSSKDSVYVVINFKVHKNGEITNVGFDRMSKISDADAAALKSVIESMPSVPPLPEGAPESIDVNFTFNYNVINTEEPKTAADKQ